MKSIFYSFGGQDGSLGASIAPRAPSCLRHCRVWTTVTDSIAFAADALSDHRIVLRSLCYLHSAGVATSLVYKLQQTKYRPTSGGARALQTGGTTEKWRDLKGFPAPHFKNRSGAMSVRRSL